MIEICVLLHANIGFSAHLVKWITESNHLVNIINDHELCKPLCAGCPNIELPSPDVLSCNIKVAFEKCSEHIRQLLCVSFLLISEIWLTQWLGSPNADNVTANDTQTMKLTSLDNSFESVNCIQCFNHTLQLSAKALLKPFNSESLSASEADDDVDVADSDELPLILDDDLEVEEVDFTSKLDDTDDDIDELEMLLQAKHEKMLDDTVAVKATITKVSISDPHLILDNIDMVDP